MKVLYRAIWMGSNFGIRFDKYKIVKETDFSFKIRRITAFGLSKEKWMRKNAKRRFARETKLEAVKDLLRRLKVREDILESNLEFVRDGIMYVKGEINKEKENDKSSKN